MTEFETERFVADADYEALAERLAAYAQPCPAAGHVTADQMRIALGELLNIWPASIRAILIRDELEDRGLIAPAGLL